MTSPDFPNPDSTAWSLAIETTSKQASVAIGKGSVASEKIRCQTDSARNLIPTIQSLLKNHEVSVAEIQSIAVAEGPGSFTGLRVGVTVAKTLAYLAKCPIIPVNTLRLMAFQAFRDLEIGQGPKAHKQISAVLDAQRKQLFVGHFSCDENLQPLSEVQIQNNPDFQSSITGDSLVTGSGLAKLSLDSTENIADVNCWLPDAESLLAFGWQEWQRGNFIDHWNLRPKYYRQSAAEEKLNS